MNAAKGDQEERGCYCLAPDALHQLAEEFAQANRRLEPPAEGVSHAGPHPRPASTTPGLNETTAAQLRESNRRFRKRHRGPISSKPRHTPGSRYYGALTVVTVIGLASGWFGLRLFL